MTEEGLLQHRIIEKDTEIERLRRALEWHREVLKAIRDFDPPEVCKDEFAYDRFKHSIRECAESALHKDAPPAPELPPHSSVEPEAPE